MSKLFEFTYKGKDYKLEYTRKSIEVMERQGFDVSAIEGKPVTSMVTLFRGAFLANHPTVKQEAIDEIFSHMTNRQELMSKLCEMYAEPIEALYGEPEPDEGNIVWGASF